MKRKKTVDTQTDRQVAIAAIQAVMGCGVRKAALKLATVDVAKLAELERAGKRTRIVLMLYPSTSLEHSS